MVPPALKLEGFLSGDHVMLLNRLFVAKDKFVNKGCVPGL